MAEDTEAQSTENNDHDQDRLIEYINGLPYPKRLYYFVDQQIQEGKRRWTPPWAPRFVKLHRINIADINYDLAVIKKRYIEDTGLSKKDIRKLRRLLDSQATALRNLEYIRSLDCLNPWDKAACKADAERYFADVSQAQGWVEGPFDSGLYTYIANKEEPYPHGDLLRHWLCCHLPVWFTYSEAEKLDRKGDYQAKYVPIGVGPRVERLARLIIALFGAISILVPMIIMSLHESKTKSLITTSVFVISFAFFCSLTLQTSNDQTLAATAAYAAVLMVFVGLSS